LNKNQEIQDELLKMMQIEEKQKLHEKDLLKSLATLQISKQRAERSSSRSPARDS
jgi:hypothetical protein